MHCAQFCLEMLASSFATSESIANLLVCKERVDSSAVAATAIANSQGLHLEIGWSRALLDDVS
jgi:hypothetical protein